MNYLITVANGDWMTERTVTEVRNVVVRDGVYILFDSEGSL